MIRRSSRVLIVGLVLLVLGLGNWRMGADKVAQYGRRMEYARTIGGPGADEPFRGTASILDTRTAAHELYEDSSDKYQYYLVVYRGGRLLTVIGLVLICGAVARRILVPVR